MNKSTLKSRRIYWIMGCILLLVAAIGTWMYYTIRTVTIIVDRGYTDKARFNSLLAAERLLTQQHIPTNTHTGLGKLYALPPTDTAIVITGYRDSMSKTMSDSLYDWVQLGGLLIIEGRQIHYGEDEEGTIDDHLLNTLGVSVYYSNQYDDSAESWMNDFFDDDQLNQEQDEVTSDDTDDAPAMTCVNDYTYYDGLTRIILDDKSLPLSLDLSTSRTLYDSKSQAVLWGNSTYGTHFLQFEVGQGHINVFTDLWIWENDEVGLYDHAYLLWLLVKDQRSVLFIHDTSAPSLLTLLWRHAAPLIISFAVLLLLWLLNARYRFGSLLPNPSLDRRQLLEHIDASGHFLWRHKSEAQLISQLRYDIDKKMHKHHREYNQLSQTKQFKLISLLSKLPNEHITWAMTFDTKHKQFEFTRLIQYLQTIRKQL